jgi:hypothetical protein
MAPRGQSLELFFIDGTPDGMLTATMFNWTGHVLMTPRIRLVEALKRKEAAFTGVYLLLGESLESSLTRGYIGESEDVADRIRNHDATRDWWDQVVLITSSANSLNKAHVKFLESRLIEEAKRAGTMTLENIVTPARPSLSEAAEADMEQFIDHLLTVLPAIRVDGFLVRSRGQQVIETAKNEPELKHTAQFQMRLNNGEVDAKATLDGGEFIVQPGSIGRANWIGVDHNYKKLFDEVVKSGSYILEGGMRKFANAYAFSSPSAAGAVLSGRATAGPIAWVLVADPSKTYKAWEAEQLGL